MADDLTAPARCMRASPDGPAGSIDGHRSRSGQKGSLGKGVPGTNAGALWVKARAAPLPVVMGKKTAAWRLARTLPPLPQRSVPSSDEGAN